MKTLFLIFSLFVMPNGFSEVNKRVLLAPVVKTEFVFEKETKDYFLSVDFLACEGDTIAPASEKSRLVFNTLEESERETRYFVGVLLARTNPDCATEKRVEASAWVNYSWSERVFKSKKWTVVPVQKEL